MISSEGNRRRRRRDDETEQAADLPGEQPEPVVVPDAGGQR